MGTAEETMRWGVIHGILVVVHGEEQPRDAEWEAYMKGFDRRGAIRGGLAVTDGPGPNGRQRELVARLPRQFLEMPFAVITTSLVVRGIVTALGWGGTNILAFSPGRADSAFAYLKVAPAHRLDILRQIAADKARLAGGVTIEAVRDRGVLQEDVLTQKVSDIRKRLEQRK
jgi:hypothetical protein